MLKYACFSVTRLDTLFIGTSLSFKSRRQLKLPPLIRKPYLVNFVACTKVILSANSLINEISAKNFIRIIFCMNTNFWWWLCRLIICFLALESFYCLILYNIHNMTSLRESCDYNWPYFNECTTDDWEHQYRSLYITSSKISTTNQSLYISTNSKISDQSPVRGWL